MKIHLWYFLIGLDGRGSWTTVEWNLNKKNLKPNILNTTQVKLLNLSRIVNKIMEIKCKIVNMRKTLTSCGNVADYYRQIDGKYELNVSKLRLVTKFSLSLSLSCSDSLSFSPFKYLNAVEVELNDYEICSTASSLGMPSVTLALSTLTHTHTDRVRRV